MTKTKRIRKHKELNLPLPGDVIVIPKRTGLIACINNRWDKNDVDVLAVVVGVDKFCELLTVLINKKQFYVYVLDLHNTQKLNA